MEELPRRKHYFFLLHLWQERPPAPGSPGEWRITLEGTRHGERHGFAGLEELVAFLRAEVMGEEGEKGRREKGRKGEREKGRKGKREKGSKGRRE